MQHHHVCVQCFFTTSYTVAPALCSVSMFRGTHAERLQLSYSENVGTVIQRWPKRNCITTHSHVEWNTSSSHQRSLSQLLCCWPCQEHKRGTINATQPEGKHSKRKRWRHSDIPPRHGLKLGGNSLPAIIWRYTVINGTQSINIYIYSQHWKSWAELMGNQIGE